MAIAWLPAKALVSAVIIGTSKMDHLEDNLQAANLTLSAEDVETHDEVPATSVPYPNLM